MITHPKARTVLVTGAARRIGAAIVEHLAEQGWSVALHHRDSAAEAEQVTARINAKGGRAIAIAADLTEPNAIMDVIAKTRTALGPLTALVNNASQFRYDNLPSLAPDSLRAHMQINLEAPIFLTQAFAQELPSGAQGAVVNIIDQRAWKPTPEYFSYSLTKSALWSATRMMAQALAPRIRVNAIGPGPVLQSIHQTDAEFQAEVATTLLGRPTTPAEIARTTAFLLDASSITGQMIALDAGQHLSWPLEGAPAAGPDARPDTKQP